MPFAENIHGEIFKLIDGPEQKDAIAVPRGWGEDKYNCTCADGTLDLIPSHRVRKKQAPISQARGEGTCPITQVAAI